MNMHFKSSDEMYRQIDGVAIGSHLGLILADILLSKLENFSLAKQIDKFSFYCRYMDWKLN